MYVSGRTNPSPCTASLLASREALAFSWAAPLPHPFPAQGFFSSMMGDDPPLTLATHWRSLAHAPPQETCHSRPTERDTTRSNRRDYSRASQTTPGKGPGATILVRAHYVFHRFPVWARSTLALGRLGRTSSSPFLLGDSLPFFCSRERSTLRTSFDSFISPTISPSLPCLP